MKIKLTLFLILFISTSTLAQWVSRAPFPGIARAKAVSFSVGDTLYVMGGVTNTNSVLKDFWKYDVNGNSWTQMPDFPGEERYGATSFILGNTGYVATGGNDNGYLDDLWQYIPSTAQWVQRNGMPAGSAQHENQRVEAYAFVINNKAYLGGGNGFVFGANSTNNIAFTDLWEYDPSHNSWSPLSSVPDVGKDLSVAAVLNDKAYIGLGCNVDQTINYKTFWEYDPTTDNWAQKANFPSEHTVDAGAFVYNSEMYVVGGVQLTTLALSNEVYKYNPITNVWTLTTSYGGGAVAGQFTATSGSHIISGGGYNASIIARNDVWEFTASSTGINSTILDESSFQLYPNPASEYISINHKGDISGIEIIDPTGRIVYRNDHSSEPINIADLPRGIYRMRFQTKNGFSKTEPFIKQ